jgi:hypothetical protein
MWLVLILITVFVVISLAVLFVAYRQEIKEFFPPVGGALVAGKSKAPSFLEWIKFKVKGK